MSHCSLHSQQQQLKVITYSETDKHTSFADCSIADHNTFHCSTWRATAAMVHNNNNNTERMLQTVVVVQFSLDIDSIVQQSTRIRECSVDKVAQRTFTIIMIIIITTIANDDNDGVHANNII